MPVLTAVILDSYLWGGVMILGSTVLAVVGLLLVHRLVDTRSLVSCHDVGSSLLSVVGTLYAVILGLIVVESMGRFQEAHTVVEAECNALADLVLLANRLPTLTRTQIHRHAALYADVVMHEEWPMMDRGRTSRRAHRSALNLLAAVADYEPVTESQKAVYAAALEASAQLWNSRRSRTGTVARGIPWLEWFVLVLGGTITIVFTYFFALKQRKVQIAMTAMVAMIISLNIYLVAMFGYPYSGDLKVSAERFDVAELLLEHERVP